ncbi:TcpQ domain-containing protein [Rahnella inusitata]|uniref:Pilus assembly protein n=2 Tax=Rahnella inusitata TaxID=58169 RepID=A0ABX9P6J7_9GAMM|nr:pilus assembly protein [Serratia sp. (in: enterobacteria)]QUT17346.1 TcpQ domain-containing protein [Rahnella inusitata]RJT16398.1 pilus assembly protein [Rahnella inusitata]
MVAPTYPTRALVLHENVLLSQALNQWAKDSGYKMLWNSNKDYMIYSTITYTGATTDDVLGDLGKLFSSENYGLVIKLYQKNKVLLVDEQ